MAHPLELPKDRLATTDADGDRVFLHPLEVSGFFRRWRNVVYFSLVAIFLILPWTTVNSVQTILLDIPRRRFSLFGLTFWAHDAPMMFFVLAGTAFSLAFIATVWGRVWCGWMCPQTVFIDVVFRRIESWVEGRAHARRTLDRSPMTADKFFKRTAKWFLFLVATLVITNSFLAYFVGADRMLQMVQRPPQENILAFVFTLIVTIIFLFNFGWFREQFCVIMCPYGRLQSILMDQKSLTVLYDVNRGEPRGPLRKNPTTPTGDCVDCYRCVSVCPTGIDIRRGQQLECIGCTACIDACDEIMTNIKKPTGLIRYDRLESVSSAPGVSLRPAVLIYLAIVIFIFSGLAYVIATHEPVSATLLRASGSPYSDGGEGLIVNHFNLEMNNSLFKPVELVLESTEDPRGTSDRAQVRIVTAMSPVVIPEGRTSRINFFVHFPKTILQRGKSRAKLRITGRSEDRRFTLNKEISLVGPIE